mmetsp:Transcript_28271/g.44072  ORF Transcript_28271/g.44072 Transcript_28271/m.44072 type:complete len:724 (+) Transcript_28271:60-2231(+)
MDGEEEQKKKGNGYNWSLMGLEVKPDQVVPPAAEVSKETRAKAIQAIIPEKEPSIEILKELQKLRTEHQDINQVTDRLQDAAKTGAFVGNQLSALKKRKLMLKDRIAQLESQLVAAEVEESEESEEFEDEEAITEQIALQQMISILKEAGLRPDAVPPHKDSFFMALMKALQRAGLRPRGYDFRESGVMGSKRQFPYAAKRAKAEVLSLLSSQVGKLNGIGGWQLSPEEFKRYFSKAWWTVPAARHDLFMASAHLFSVTILCYSISEEGLEEQRYDPPGGAPRATLRLCRRGEHVISSAPIEAEVSAEAFAPPPEDEVDSALRAEKLASLPPPLVKPANFKPESPGAPEAPEDDGIPTVDGDEGLDAGLGLLETVEAYEEEEMDDRFEGYRGSTIESSVEDDEVLDSSSIDRKIGNMYGEVATRRLFVAVTLEDQERDQVSRIVEDLKRTFPLDTKALDSVVRWVQPQTLHITLQTLDVREDRLGEAEELCQRVVKELGVKEFSVRAGDIGCFWRAAGSGWGRVPRVVWLGLEDQDLKPLVRLHQALGSACVQEGLLPDKRPFCAHITLGKTRPTESLRGPDRRLLRAFGKWLQDRDRPVNLQALLQDGSQEAIQAAGGVGTGRRGSKRLKAWMKKNRGDPALISKLTAIRKAPKLGHRKAPRDLGKLNFEIAEEMISHQEFIHEDVRVEVKAVSIVEAVPVPGSKHITYKTIGRIPLGRTEE